MSWKIKELLKEQLAQEEGYYSFPQGSRIKFALLYPNSYFVGMSNLGLHIVYKLLNQRNDTACERFFLPEKKLQEEHIKHKTPLLSLENQIPLANFHILGFVISFEMDYFNILRMLELSHIKALAKERGERDPLLIGGGPCATFNPKPLAPFFDAFVIGEGEAVLPKMMDAYAKALEAGLSKDEILNIWAKVPGIYVPKVHDAIDKSPVVKRQWLRNLDDFPGETVIHTPNTEFNLHLIEVARGCGRHCRFCMAGYCFRNPRTRSLEELKKRLTWAKKKGQRVGLMGAAVSDYPEIDALCREILGEGLSMSVASFRADSVTEELVNSMAKSGLKTLTMAPEAGSSRLRRVINKGIEEEHLFKAISLGVKAGIRNYRLYIMIGLPGEEPQDLEAISEMALRLKDYMEELGCKGRLTLSINPFIPKPFTPFQWEPMAPLKYIQAALKDISAKLKKRHNIEIIAESPKEAYIQAFLARGDKEAGHILWEAYLRGGSKAIRQILKEQGKKLEDEVSRAFSMDTVFPWDNIDMGFSKEYLWQEREKALADMPKATNKCVAGCKRCGVCD